jgi:predicted MPP superfamily phosphohydrolase
MPQPPRYIRNEGGFFYAIIAHMALRYIIFFTSFLGVLFLGSYSIYKAYSLVNIFSKTGNTIMLWVLIAMPILFIATTFISMKTHFLLNDVLYTIACVWLPILLYLFLGSIILTIFSTFIPITNTAFYTFITYGILLTSFVLGVYGTINAHIFTVNNITIPKENKLSRDWSGKKIVLVSDTHIGIIHKNNFLDKTVKFINSQNGDLILFAGDLVDGPKMNQEKYLKPLENLHAPLGVYYTPGNHEIYYGDEKELYNFTDKYMTGLRDSKITVNNTEIIGLMYDAGETPEGLENRLYKVGFDKNKQNILIIHEPKNNNILQSFGVDLSVSGHTHGGQFWPITMFVNKIFKEYTHNLVVKNNTASVTSTGIGTWGPPVRIGTKPEIIVITFE